MAENIQPIHAPQDGLRRTWNLENLYVGPQGTDIQRWVPNVDDMIWDWATGWFRVTHIDETNNYLATLVSWKDPSTAGGVADEDVLLGAGPGTQSESYRVFTNSTLTPFTGEFDGRLRIYARRASYIKLFRGRDATGNGTVISAMYDQSNNFVSNKVPLELVQNPYGENLAIKSPTKFWLTQQMDNGESVTAIVYGQDDEPLSSSHLLIVNSQNYMHGGAATKYITSIRLDSQFMADGEESLVQMPLSMPVASAMFRGIVTYSNGDVLSLPVDGTKFQLAGINSYISSELGGRMPLRLIYVLSPEENAAVVNGNETYRFIDRPYEVETVEAMSNYNVKLFTYPVWNAGLNKYTLKHFLTNLDREEVWDVTAATHVHVNSPAFDGSLYNQDQNLTFVVELDEVDSMFADFRHVIPATVNLASPGTVTGPKWTMRFSAGLDVYGGQLFANASDAGGGNWEFNVGSGIATVQEWIDKAFYATGPIFNPSSEAQAPQPTHFALIVDGVEVTRTVSDYDQDISVATSGLAQGSNVYIRFEQHVGADVYVLGYSGISVDNV